MALRADHRNMNAPDPEPRFLRHLAEQLATDREAEGHLEHSVPGTKFRHSDAGKCSRALSYTFAGIAPTDEPDASGLWNFRVGTFGHDIFQAALSAAFGDAAQIEATCHDPEFDGSGHADAIVTFDDTRTMYELKTVGGFAYKMAVGERSDPEGPKPEHIIQGALNALAADCDQLVIGYLSKEAISINGAKRKNISELGRFMAEWSFPRDVFEPIALAERSRITSILGLVADGTLAAGRFPVPDLPAGATIVDPSTGRWEVVNDGDVIDTGTWWACGYCSHRSLCVQLEPGRIPVEQAVAIS